MSQSIRGAVVDWFGVRRDGNQFLNERHPSILVDGFGGGAYLVEIATLNREEVFFG